jgi:hypothetical protein
VKKKVKCKNSKCCQDDVESGKVTTSSDNTLMKNDDLSRDSFHNVWNKAVHMCEWDGASQF